MRLFTPLGSRKRVSGVTRPDDDSFSRERVFRLKRTTPLESGRLATIPKTATFEKRTTSSPFFRSTSNVNADRRVLYRSRLAETSRLFIRSTLPSMFIICLYSIYPHTVGVYYAEATNIRVNSKRHCYHKT